MSSFETLEAQLRAAAESRQYADVERLVVEYCAAARSHVGCLSQGSAGAQEAMASVLGTLQWTNRMLQTGREQIVLELNRLPRLKRYLQTPSAGETVWAVEG